MKRPRDKRPRALRRKIANRLHDAYEHKRRSYRHGNPFWRTAGDKAHEEYTRWIGEWLRYCIQVRNKG